MRDYYLYLDKVYAIREFSLNRLLMLQPNSNWDFLHEGMNLNAVKADYPIFSLSFTDVPAYTYTPGEFGCVVLSFDIGEITIVLSPDGGTPYALISSVFFQFGPANTVEFEFVIYPSIWNSGIWS